VHPIAALLIMAGLLMGSSSPAAARDGAGNGSSDSDAGVVLVADRNLTGSYFTNTVVLLLQHDDHGSIGVILNRRTGFLLEQLLPELPQARKSGHAIYLGGPVSPDTLLMLMRHEKTVPGIAPLMDGVSFSLEREVLETLLERRKPARDLRVYAGYTGWTRGQLANELAFGAWRVMRADAAMIFHDNPDDLWEELIDRLDPPGLRVHAPHVRDPATPSGTIECHA
jgi:putative transcriptional regulator